MGRVELEHSAVVIAKRRRPSHVHTRELRHAPKDHLQEVNNAATPVVCRGCAAEVPHGRTGVVFAANHQLLADHAAVSLQDRHALPEYRTAFHRAADRQGQQYAGGRAHQVRSGVAGSFEVPRIAAPGQRAMSLMPLQVGMSRGKARVFLGWVGCGSMSNCPSSAQLTSFDAGRSMPRVVNLAPARVI